MLKPSLPWQESCLQNWTDTEHVKTVKEPGDLIHVSPSKQKSWTYQHLFIIFSVGLELETLVWIFGSYGNRRNETAQKKNKNTNILIKLLKKHYRKHLHLLWQFNCSYQLRCTIFMWRQTYSHSISNKCLPFYQFRFSSGANIHINNNCPLYKDCQLIEQHCYWQRSHFRGFI